MNSLSDNFYRVPDVARQTMTRKEWKQVLLDTGGQILTCGRMRTLKGKHLEAGVYLVTLLPLEGK